MDRKLQMKGPQRVGQTGIQTEATDFNTFLFSSGWRRAEIFPTRCIVQYTWPAVTSLLLWSDNFIEEEAMYNGWPHRCHLHAIRAVVITQRDRASSSSHTLNFHHHEENLIPE